MAADAANNLYIVGETQSYSDPNDPDNPPSAPYPLMQLSGAYWQSYLDLIGAYVPIGAPDGFITKFDIDPSITGIKNIKQENGCMVYPNPTSNTIRIDAPGLKGENITMEIVNVLGQKVFEAPYFQNEINVSKLTSGVYLLKLTSNGTTEIAKFVKE